MKKYKHGLIKLWRYKADSKSKQRQKTMRHLKVLVGRLIRVFERNVAKSGIELSTFDQALLAKIKRVHTQSFLNKKAKSKYKTAGNKILYSFHAEEVECIYRSQMKNKVYKKYLNINQKVANQIKSSLGKNIRSMRDFEFVKGIGPTSLSKLYKVEDLKNIQTSFDIPENYE